MLAPPDAKRPTCSDRTLSAIDLSQPFATSVWTIPSLNALRTMPSCVE
jgi:hypothetical protein